MKFKEIFLLLLTALLVAATATSNAAEIYNKEGNKLELFGKFDGLLHYVSSDNSTEEDQSYMHIGFKGETQVNDKLTGYGSWEYKIQSNTAERENNYTRVVFTGLKFGDTGYFEYGRSYGVVYDITSWTDVLPSFGGDTYCADNFMQYLGNNFVTYRNIDFFGLVDRLNFAIQYQARNSSSVISESNKNSRSALKQNGNGVGESITYDLGEGFSIGSAVSSSKRTSSQNEMGFGTGGRANTYTGGIKYDANNIYLAAQYTQTYKATRAGNLGWANKAQNFELVAQYQLDFGLRPSVAYLQSKGKNMDNSYGDQDILKYVEVGATYSFNKNMSTYFDYKINLLNDNNDFIRHAGICTDDIIALGLVYQF